jgi:hypothetical protein
LPAEDGVGKQAGRRLHLGQARRRQHVARQQRQFTDRCHAAGGEGAGQRRGQAGGDQALCGGGVVRALQQARHAFTGSLKAAIRD